MLVRFTTKNVDGLKTEWCFNSVEAVLKDWWANDAEKLPSGDDPVLEFILNGAPVPSIETVDSLINFLNIYYWKQQELPEEDIIGTLNTLKDAFVEIESDEIRYMQIQESCEGGYDYTYFDEDGSEIDGGQLDIDENEYQMGDAVGYPRCVPLAWSEDGLSLQYSWAWADTEGQLHEGTAWYCFDENGRFTEIRDVVENDVYPVHG